MGLRWFDFWLGWVRSLSGAAGEAAEVEWRCDCGWMELHWGGFEL